MDTHTHKHNNNNNDRVGNTILQHALRDGGKSREKGERKYKARKRKTTAVNVVYIVSLRFELCGPAVFAVNAILYFIYKCSFCFWVAKRRVVPTVS